jgi:hypothetical protein
VTHTVTPFSAVTNSTTPTRSPKTYSISLSGTSLVYVSERRTGLSEIDIALQFFLTVQAHGTNGRFPGQGSRFNSPHLHIFLLHINFGLG